MLLFQIQNVTVQMFCGNFLSSVWVIFHMQLTAHVILLVEYVFNVLENKPQKQKRDKLKVKLTSQADGISSDVEDLLGPNNNNSISMKTENIST